MNVGRTHAPESTNETGLSGHHMQRLVTPVLGVAKNGTCIPKSCSLSIRIHILPVFLIENKQILAYFQNALESQDTLRRPQFLHLADVIKLGEVVRDIAPRAESRLSYAQKPGVFSEITVEQYGSTVAVDDRYYGG
jgi:hypothetical protein